MTRQEALHIQDNLLARCKYNIPSSIVYEVFRMYVEHIDAETYKVAPCSCTPHHWRDILAKLRVAVDSVLAEPEPTPQPTPDYHIEGVTIEFQEDKSTVTKNKKNAKKSTSND